MTDSGRDPSGLVEEARKWKARSEAVLPVLEMLPDATVKQVATYMRQAVEQVDRLRDALTASLERERGLQAKLDWMIEVTEDFLRAEYPDGTDHPSDHEAARLQRALDAARPDGEGDGR